MIITCSCFSWASAEHVQASFANTAFFLQPGHEMYWLDLLGSIKST